MDVVTIANESEMSNTMRVNPRRRSLKGILLLFVEPFSAGARDSETFVHPNVTKVNVKVNGVLNMLYNNGIEGKDMWEEASRNFVKKKKQTENMTTCLVSG